MQTVGSVLREERLRLGLTLETVSADTKLTPRSLIAIESDDISTFASAFFYKSFVKQYAAWLMVDYSQIALLVEDRAGEIPPPPLPGRRDRLVSVLAMDTSQNGSGSRWMFPSLALIAVLIGCSGVYAWWEGQHGPNAKNPVMPASEAHSKVSVAVVQVPPTGNIVPATATSTTVGSGASNPESSTTLPAGSPPVVSPEGTPQAEPASTPVTGPTASAIPAAFAAEVQLKLSALERVWVSVMADGKSTFSGVLEVSETRFFESRESAEIKVGNAGGLQVVYNGKSIGALGPRGQVLTAVFTPQSYEILGNHVAPAPHVELTKYPVGE
jgi:cytoskeleton protein RodZ